jgi:hypothetical protein
MWEATGLQRGDTETGQCRRDGDFYTRNAMGKGQARRVVRRVPRTMASHNASSHTQLLVRPPGLRRYDCEREVPTESKARTVSHLLAASMKAAQKSFAYDDDTSQCA